MNNEQTTNIDAVRKDPLTKAERNKLYGRYLQYNAPGFDYVYYMGKSWPWWLKPLFRQFYNDKGYAEAMSRHFDFYNSESTTAALLYGIVVGMEEQKAIEGKISGDTIREIKVSLQGPIAGIGDSLIQATLLPILMTIAMSLAGENGSVAGPLFYVAALFGILIPYTYILFNKGYQLGSKAFAMLSPDNLSRITEAVSSFGLVVVGALAAKTCNASLALSYMSNGESVLINDSINSIFPNLLSLLIVFFLYWLMKHKKVSSSILVYGLIAVVVILALVGAV